MKAKDPKNRSKKDCVCGGHNLNNVKKNKKHNSTHKRLLRRKLRREKRNRMEWKKI
jgi:hypothetical protein